MSSALSRRWHDAWVLGGALTILSVPLLTWWSTVGPVSEYFRYAVPDGQRVYLLSKLVGLYAIIGFWVQASYGLLGATWRRQLRIEWGLGFHRALGLSILLLAACHAMLFVVAAGMRAHHFPSQYLQISFAHGFYRSMISLGLIALLATLIAVIAALTRVRIGPTFRYAHWIALPAFLLVLFHSLRIGSETRMSPLSFLYLLMLMSTISLVAMRMLSAGRRA